MKVIRIVVSSILLALAAPAMSQVADFSGAWQGWLCPEGVKRESGKCSTFVLELHQRGGRLCGTHMFSTADASRVDEGSTPSVSGEVHAETAEIRVTSTLGRVPVQVKAELRRVGAGMQWTRLDAPSGDYLLPQKARLAKARKKSLFAPVFEHELRAICLSSFTTAEQNAANEQRSNDGGAAPEAAGK